MEAFYPIAFILFLSFFILVYIDDNFMDDIVGLCTNNSSLKEKIKFLFYVGLSIFLCGPIFISIYVLESKYKISFNIFIFNTTILILSITSLLYSFYFTHERTFLLDSRKKEIIKINTKNGTLEAKKIITFEECYVCILKDNSPIILEKDTGFSIHHPAKVEVSSNPPRPQ